MVGAAALLVLGLPTLLVGGALVVGGGVLLCGGVLAGALVLSSVPLLFFGPAAPALPSEVGSQQFLQR